MYLYFVSMQDRFHQRYHKGMPLCNIGFALGKMPGHRRWQAQSWSLGIIEDCLTNSETVEAAANFKNLLSMRGVTVPILRQLISNTLSRYTEDSITPLYPELCIDTWLAPTSPGASEASVKCVENLLGALRDAYPYLPDVTKCVKSILAFSARRRIDDLTASVFWILLLESKRSVFNVFPLLVSNTRS